MQTVKLTPAQQRSPRCRHTQQARAVTPSGDGCGACLELGDTWVHLRVCMSCGHVGCCNSSKNKHATKHFQNTEHPIVRSLEPGETWTYCYEEGVML